MKMHIRAGLRALPFVVSAVVTMPVFAQTPTAKVVAATNAFLATLDATQRAKTVFAYDDAAQRVRWSNFPTAIVQRAGVKFGEMNDTQRAAAMKLLSTALSKRGFEKVQQIVDADEALKNQSAAGGSGAGGGGRGGRGGPGGGLLFGSAEYYFSVLGTPSEKTPWMLQFGGHHLALNLTVDGAAGILTPSLTGAQPSTYIANGKTIRPLGEESDKALALLNSLDDAQRKQAVLAYRVADLVLGPGQDGKTIQPEGLKASSMTVKQKEMLLGVIAEWAGIVHETAADARMKDIAKDIDDTWFAWSGPATTAASGNITAYYRIQGPKLVIEYAPQGMGGDPSLHIHAMYRDPTNDYGRGPVGKR